MGKEARKWGGEPGVGKYREEMGKQKKGSKM